MQGIEQATTQALLVCVAGPDAGKRFLLTAEPVLVGKDDGCHVILSDGEAGARHAAFVMKGGRPRFEAVEGSQVYVDGHARTSGMIRPGEQIRIGRSFWHLADEDAAAHFATWLDRIGGKITDLAGVGRIEGFSPKKMFSEVMRHHDDESIEEYLNVGTPTTTPALGDIDTSWPRPWLFVRAALLSVLVYAGFAAGAGVWANENFVPGLIVMGAFAIPVSVLIFFLEVNVARNVSLFQVIKLLLAGGIASLLFAMVLFGLSRNGVISIDLGAMLAGPVEEVAKVGALLLIVYKLRYRWTLNGLLFGAVVGCGFAAFESAGYAFRFGFMGLMEAAQAGRDPFAGMLSSIREVTLLRGALTLCGSHIAWTALAGAALWRVRGQRAFRMSMLLEGRFLRVFVISVVLHMAWNMPERFQLPFYGNQILAGVVGWVLILAFVQDGLRQIREAQREQVQSSRTLVTSLFQGERSPANDPSNNDEW